MKAIQTVLAWVCAILLVITGAAALLAFNIERTAFSAETYKQAFEKQDLYSRMPAVLSDALYTSIAQNANADPFLKALAVQDLEAGITGLLPPQELRAISDDVLDSIFDYLNDQADSASISLLPIKRQLAGPQGVEVVRRVLAVQPECTLEQLMQMGLGFFSGDITLCKPPEEMMGLVVPMLESQLQFMAGIIPDRVVLISETHNPPNNPRAQLGRVRSLMKISVLVPIFLLITLGILAVRSLTDWLKWWGIPFLVMGAGSLIIALVGAPLIALLARNFLQGQGAGLIPPILFSTLQEAVNAAAGQILKPVVIEGAILTGLGAMMVAAFFVVRARQPKPQ